MVVGVLAYPVACIYQLLKDIGVFLDIFTHTKEGGFYIFTF